MKTFTPFSAHQFEVVSGNTSAREVEADFRRRLEWMTNQLEFFYKNELDKTVQKMIDDVTPITGSVNSFGRFLGIKPHQDYSNQPYNMAEMLRASAVSGLAGHLQDTMIIQLGEVHGMDEAAVRAAWPAEFKSPTKYHTENVLHRLTTKGVLAGVPRATGQLPLWACDMHFAKMTFSAHEVFLTVRLDNGPVTLKFRIPKGERFHDGKLTRPTVRIDRKGRLSFNFTVQHVVEAPVKVQSVLGVDLGKVFPFVGTVSNPETHEWSAPLLPNRHINWLKKKLDRLYFHKEHLFQLEKTTRDAGHTNHADVLRTEYLRIRSKISRLKVEMAHHVANQLLDIAVSFGASIAFEELGWVQAKGGKWDHARTQQATMDKARKRGIRVTTVNAAGTSDTCTKCVDHDLMKVGRFVICRACGKKLDRDISGSRILSTRLHGKKNGNPQLYSQSSTQTRVSRSPLRDFDGNGLQSDHQPPRLL